MVLSFVVEIGVVDNAAEKMERIVILRKDESDKIGDCFVYFWFHDFLLDLSKKGKYLYAYSGGFKIFDSFLRVHRLIANRGNGANILEIPLLIETAL